MSNNKEMETQLGLLGDVERADVLKTKIIEEEKTKREQIQREQETKDAVIRAEGYNAVRALLVLALIAFVVMLAMTADNVVKAWQRTKEMQIRGEHPGGVFEPTLIPAPTAALIPAPTATPDKK